MNETALQSEFTERKKLSVLAELKSASLAEWLTLGFWTIFGTASGVCVGLGFHWTVLLICQYSSLAMGEAIRNLNGAGFLLLELGLLGFGALVGVGIGTLQLLLNHIQKRAK